MNPTVLTVATVIPCILHRDAQTATLDIMAQRVMMNVFMALLIQRIPCVSAIRLASTALAVILSVPSMGLVMKTGAVIVLTY